MTSKQDKKKNPTLFDERCLAGLETASSIAVSYLDYFEHYTYYILISDEPAMAWEINTEDRITKNQNV